MDLTEFLTLGVGLTVAVNVEVFKDSLVGVRRSGNFLSEGFIFSDS